MTAPDTADTLPTEDELLAQAQALSFGSPPPEKAPAAPESSATAGKVKEDAPQPPPPASGDAPAPSSEPPPAADAKPDDAAAPKPGEAPSDFARRREERKAKEKERADRSWSRLHEEREALAREREQFARERASHESARKSPDRPAQPIRDDHGHTAADYDTLAKDYRRDGEEHLARLTEARAAALRDKQQGEGSRTSPGSSPASAPASEADLARALGEESQALMREDASLRDDNNPVVRRANALLEDPARGAFFRRHGGIRAAVEVARLQESAARVPALEKQLAERDAELARLRKATAIPGGPPSAPPKTSRAFEDMSFEEKEAALREQARSLT